MATILRGKNKGKKIKIRQWCNDWVSAEVDGRPKIFGITALEFSGKEMLDILHHKNSGVLFNYFEVIPNKNRFRRRKII